MKERCDWHRRPGVKIYMSTDLEGVAGVVSFAAQTRPGAPYYEQAKKLLTAEINAAIDGMLEAGVTQVLVGDMHGPGAISFEDLHSQALLLHGRPLAHRSVIDDVLAEYDACVMIGQHAMAGVQTGNLNHTQSSASIESYTLNGHPIGETAQLALYRGACGQPVILLTGDEDACAEAEALIPGIVTVAVKQGIGRNSAVTVSAVEAHRRLLKVFQPGVRRLEAVFGFQQLTGRIVVQPHALITKCRLRRPAD